MRFRYFALPLLACLLAACKQPSSQYKVIQQADALHLLLETYYEEKLQLFPVDATFNSETRYNDRLNIDISEGFRAHLDSVYTRYQDSLAMIDTVGMVENDKISYLVLARELELGKAGLQFHDNLMPINQFSSLTLTFPQLGSGSSAQPFKTEQDYLNFISRMKQFAVWTDTAIANMRKGISLGYVQPKALVLKVIPQVKELAINDSAKNIFFQPINTPPSDLPAATRAAYREAIQQYVITSYQKLADFLSTEYLAKARTTSGIEGVPDGKAYYQFLVKSWTTTDQTPDEIFTTGEQEVARIRSEMEQVKTSVGFKGDLPAFFEFVRNDKQFKIFNTPQAVIDSFKAIEAKIMPRVKAMYGHLPKTKFEVRQTEAFRAASASAEYIQGSADGSRPGIFYVPILDAKQFSYTGMECLFLHEAIPGHHFQISIQQENDSLPKLRRFSWMGAYGEGYALYCESLGKELGLYTNPYMYFGRLTDEIHRAIRLVVDAGMHHKGWTREQAIKYMMDNEPVSEHEATAEIERYMAIPAQALSYKIGELKIQSLRKKYTAAMGDKFKLSSFHDALLDGGCLPLSVLEMKMQNWSKQ
ncbi:uncharacterized protein (DUF885 family) [Chitinophaga skermanii]|uniref:Uncharacterized protein (DUF885 family) n=1 Tax=Chitinophaga skermanii TaxID=331697 RepID=A0A327RA25_9BACT|nr:DUF885 domain-containing protein [Chitinophaga skermanii]RAJ10767.1 uncharacterized protein (DUF885 family) [Chitinophaga skermanii]